MIVPGEAGCCCGALRLQEMYRRSVNCTALIVNARDKNAGKCLSETVDKIPTAKCTVSRAGDAEACEIT